MAPRPSSLKKCTKSSAFPPWAPYPGTRMNDLGMTFLKTLPISGYVAPTTAPT